MARRSPSPRPQRSTSRSLRLPCPRKRIASAISTKRLLLVLDNCEHLVDPSARMAQALLRASPGVSLLITSREPLRAEAESVYRVLPLATPRAGTDMELDSSRLVAQRD